MKIICIIHIKNVARFLSNLLNHMYSTYELSAENIFAQNRKSGFRESFIPYISTLHHGWSVRWKNVV